MLDEATVDFELCGGTIRKRQNVDAAMPVEGVG
jgi:hypothetical protein